jgi:hypothetical protein
VIGRVKPLRWTFLKGGLLKANEQPKEIADAMLQAQWPYTAFTRVSAGCRQNLPAACFQSAALYPFGQ